MQYVPQRCCNNGRLLVLQWSCKRQIQALRQMRTCYERVLMSCKRCLVGSCEVYGNHAIPNILPRNLAMGSSMPPGLHKPQALDGICLRDNAFATHPLQRVPPGLSQREAQDHGFTAFSLSVSLRPSSNPSLHRNPPSKNPSSPSSSSSSA